MRDGVEVEHSGSASTLVYWTSVLTSVVVTARVRRHISFFLFDAVIPERAHSGDRFGMGVG